LKRSNRQDGPGGQAAARNSGAPPEDGLRPELLRVGRVIGPHGLTGALRVRPDNPDASAFDHTARIYLELNGGVAEYKVVAARRINRITLRIVLEGVDDPGAAEKLRGATLLIAVADLPPAGPGEFYYFQVMGCEVVTTEGRRLGAIEEVFSNGANDVWVVRDAKAEVLVPVIADVVKTIDLEARKITIEAVPGLLD
jgi:16S rRNA processing protein RimM